MNNYLRHYPLAWVVATLFCCQLTVYAQIHFSPLWLHDVSVQSFSNEDTELSPNGKYILCAVYSYTKPSDDHFVVKELMTGTEIDSWPCASNSNSSCHFSIDSKYVYYFNGLQFVKRNFLAHEDVQVLENDNDANIQPYRRLFSLSPDGEYLLSPKDYATYPGASDTVNAWNLTTGRRVKQYCINPGNVFAYVTAQNAFIDPTGKYLTVTARSVSERLGGNYTDKCIVFDLARESYRILQPKSDIHVWFDSQHSKYAYVDTVLHEVLIRDISNDMQYVEIKCFVGGGHDFYPTCIALNKTCDLVAIINSRVIDGINWSGPRSWIELWSVSKRRVIDSLNVDGKDLYLGAVTLSDDGGIVVAQQSDIMSALKTVLFKPTDVYTGKDEAAGQTVLLFQIPPSGKVTIPFPCDAEIATVNAYDYFGMYADHIDVHKVHEYPYSLCINASRARSSVYYIVVTDRSEHTHVYKCIK